MVVSLIGYHDLDVVEHVRRALSLAVDDGRPLVIDLSETDMLDSIVLGSIITGHARCANRGVAAVIVADERTRPVVRNLLRVSGITVEHRRLPELVGCDRVARRSRCEEVMVRRYGGLVRADSVECCGFGWVDGKQCLEAGEVEHALGDAAAGAMMASCSPGVSWVRWWAARRV